MKSFLIKECLISQAGAFLPFFRAHSHLDTKRREPWLYDAQTLAVVRDALRLRYTFLPHWYTVFYQHNSTGAPVIRPLWVEFPRDRQTFTIDNQLMIGQSKYLTAPLNVKILNIIYLCKMLSSARTLSLQSSIILKIHAEQS